MVGSLSVLIGFLIDGAWTDGNGENGFLNYYSSCFVASPFLEKLKKRET
jgi:hypothetical protein